LIVLHFERRFPDGQPYELAAYDYTWRQPAELELRSQTRARSLASFTRRSPKTSLLHRTMRYEAWRASPAASIERPSSDPL
jgi:hypothetical protein